MDRSKFYVAVYLLLIKDDQILLLRRSKKDWHGGQYCVPAGHLEPNETITEGLLREVEEEVGLTLNPEDVKLVHTMHRAHAGYIDLYFVSHYQGIEPVNKEPEDCDELGWFPLKELPKDAIPFIGTAISHYSKGNTLSEF